VTGAKVAQVAEGAAKRPPSNLQVVLAIAGKDWRVEGRARDVLTATLFFAALVVVILGFALGPDRARLRDAAPGILWVAVAFASVLAAGRAFAAEAEDGALEALLLYPVPHELIYLGKLVGNLGLMLILSAVVTPVAIFAYGLDVSGQVPQLALTVFLGTTGFSIVSCFHSALTVNLRARESLLPILIFPLVVPVVLGAVKATAGLVGTAPIDEVGTWLQLLAVFDVVYAVVCTLVFPFAVEA
jgi:heme exporter protein B